MGYVYPPHSSAVVASKLAFCAIELITSVASTGIIFGAVVRAKAGELTVHYNEKRRSAIVSNDVFYTEIAYISYHYNYRHFKIAVRINNEVRTSPTTFPLTSVLGRGNEGRSRGEDKS